ncbi:MAG TPA: putative manganese-dependent inorganic diphosphatase [Syntrophomonadaceae bacterium]|nr:putative manganese-dependent inorganic diphosphatase [Syntrophomonadaceae bacterium]HPU48646.1 putative manganese-dependent inorganic diphosphatase [Syntrophomonadaceae bacterium]
MKPIMVIGHKNPDVDSVAAAISYKIYKQTTDQGLYIAAAAGEINEETSFILDYLDFEPPALVRNVRNTVEDLLDDHDTITVGTDMTLAELGNLMRSNDLKTVPVLDPKGRLLGLITIGDLAMIFMDNLAITRDVSRAPEILRELLSRRVTEVMITRDLVLFEKDELVEEARKQMLATRYRNYPVVDESNVFLGFISRHNLLEMKRKQLILVDHNERKQAVDGVEEAEILEIVDHHRVGDLQTISPIYFHNEPVGSTCTLIAEKFLTDHMALGASLAGLLLSGIISDTMIFKSPTTTAKDRNIAQQLQEIAGLDPLDWGKQIFSHAINTENQSDEELITSDLKEYNSGSLVFAISQLETIDAKRMASRRGDLLKSLEELAQRRGYAFVCLMVTDILEEATELLIAGEKSHLVKSAFGPQEEGGGIFLKGVLSRKKQVVPVLYEALTRQNFM